MSIEFSSNSSYEAARNLRGSHLILGGQTYPHRDWIKSQGGTWDKRGSQWRILTDAPGSMFGPTMSPPG